MCLGCIVNEGKIDKLDLCAQGRRDENSDDACLFELGDIVESIAQFSENFFGVGAQGGRWCCRLWIAAVQAKSRADHGDLVIDFRSAGEFLDEVTVGDLFMV